MDTTVEADPLWGATRIHARAIGRGAPTRVFIHGWATTHAVWEPVLDRWSRFDGTALAIDLPGVGWSSKPPTGYTIDRWASCVARLVDTLEGPVQLVGHSMGGLVAQRAALMLGHRIDRLVLVSPVPASGVALPAEAVAGFAALAGTRAGFAQVLTSMMAAPPPESNVQALIDASSSILDAAFVEGLHAWTGADFSLALADLSVPTRVLCGALEQPLSPDLLRNTVLQHIAGATLSTLPGCGHYAQLEAPDAFCDALADALES